MNNFNTQKWISQSYSSEGYKVTPLLTVFQASFLGKNILNQKFNGGSVWESNPPCPFVTGNTGFEVRERHQSPIHSRVINYRIPYKRMYVK